MKKKLIIFIGVFLAFIIFITFSDGKEATGKDIKKNTIKEKIKEKSNFITTSYDHTDELLEDIIEEVIVIDYVCLEEENKTDINSNEDEVKEEFPIKNGFVNEGDNTYYYIDDVLQIGEKEIDENKYYFNEDGIMVKNEVVDKKYYDEEGKLYIGFKEIEGNTYYFDEGGYIVGEKEIDEGKYFFDENGIMKTNTFIDNVYYKSDGKKAFGETTIDNKLYYFDENGMVKDKFINDKYYDINGVYISGFIKENDNIYYLDNNNKVKGLKLINNIRYYFDFETGVLLNKNVKSVIDISTWQGNINFDELKKSNLVDGVIVRLGFGSLIGEDCTLDNKFERNISELKRVGLPYGVYFFGYAQNEYASEIEANFVKDIINKYDLELSFPIFYDAELQTFNGVTYTKTMYRRVINKFIDVLNKNGYKDVGVYGNLYMLTNGGLSTIKNSIPKWVAQYYDRCQYEDSYVGWQYTSSGSIPGVNGRVDMNIFY